MKRSPSKKRRIIRAATTRRPSRLACFEKMLVQRYMENPLLQNGRKIDIRAFMVVLCCKPWFVFSCPGYARSSLSPFTTQGFGKKESGHLTQRLVHETKLCV